LPPAVRERELPADLDSALGDKSFRVRLALGPED